MHELSKTNQELREENQALRKRIEQLEQAEFGRQANESVLLKKIQQERDVLQAVMNCAKRVYLVYLDRNFNFVRVNEAYATTCGYRPEEMIGKNHFALYPHAENEAIFAHVRDTGQSVAYLDKPFFFTDQPERGTTYGDWTLTPVMNDSGKVEGLVFSLVETTERKRMEEALAESEKRYRILVETANEGIWWMDGNHLTTYVNKSMAKMLGYQQSEMLGKKVEDFFFPEDISFHKEKMKKRHAGEDEVYERRLQCRDGSELWTAVSAKALLDDQGRFAGSFAMFTDITERKQAEDVLRHTEQRLRLANRATNDVIWDWDIITDMQQWNESGTIVFGWTEIVERPVNADWWVQRVHPDDRQRIHDTFFGVVNNPLSDAWRDEYRFLKTDGSYADVLDRGYVLRDEQGKAVRMVGAMLDITERKKAEEAVREKEDAMRAILDATTEALCMIDVEGTLLMINTTFANRFNKTSEDLIGTSIYDLITPELAKTRREQVNLVLRSCKPIQFEDQRGNRFIEHSLYPIFDSIGNVSRIAIYARDITEHKRAEEQNRFLGAITANMSDSIVTTDAGYAITYMNKKAQELFGYSMEELIGKKPDIFNAEPMAEKMQQEIYEAVSSGGVYFGEFLNRRKDGSTFICEYKVTPLIGENGKPYAYIGMQKDITDRKREENALRESEEKFRSYIDNAPDGVFIADETGRYIEVNRAACEITGYSEAELLKMHIPDLLQEFERQKGIQHFQEVHQKGLARGDIGFVTKSGENRFWHVVAIKLSDTRFLGFAKDITDRKQAEESLRESEERFKALHNASFGGIAIHDKGVILDCNRGMSEMTGYSLEELTEMDGLLLIAPQSRKKVMDNIMAGYEKPYEAMGIRKNGEEYYLRLEARNVPYKGKMVRTVEFRDITERKRAEDALRESEELFRVSMEKAPDGVFMNDLDGNLIYGNRKAEEIIGYRREEFIGRNFLGTNMIAESSLGKAYELFKANIEGKSTGPDDLEIIRKDGRHILIEIMTNVIQRKGQTNVLAFVRDITERRQIEEEKLNLEERLRRAEKMESLGLLAGGVAHDLNNVLGIVVGYSEMLIDEMDPSNPMREDLEKILEGGNRSAAIVQDLLTLARRGVQTKKIVNLNATINDCQKLPEFQKVLSYNPHVKLQLDLESDLLNIMGSPVHLSKTIINLTANAAEAMPEGGVLKILTANQYLDMPIHGYDNIREGDYVVLAVSDTGEGIPERDIKRIFEPFYTKKIMGRSGTGLGLAVVWGTIKDHNGYINVESKEGKGTTFILYFPVIRENIESEQISVSISEYLGKGEAILIVDDVSLQRELACRMLSKLNYRVKTAASGEEAIEYLKMNKADLIVLDMIMEPGIDGLETYETILKLNPVQKAIIVSGFSESDRARKAQAIGAGAYIPKPYVLERLGMAVRKELDKK